MKALITGIAVLMLLGFVTITTAENAADATRAMGQVNMKQICPASLPGVEISTATTTEGIAVSFTATSGNVAELQRRVELLANMHTMMGGSPNMPMPNHGNMPIMHGNTPNRVPAGEVAYEELAKGARLTFKAKDTADLTEFRRQIESRVEQMKKGDCNMMGTMMQDVDHPMHNSGTSERK